MSPTRRGRAVLTTLVVILVLGGGVAAAALIGSRGARSAASENQGSTPGSSATSPAKPAPPSKCPLSGLAPTSGTVPVRPALAVKVENLPAARPQTGLSWADIVYEEPVEGGITRFIAIYQCQDASRIEPVRSARLTDADVLRQFGHPLFGYSGAVPGVRQAAAAAGVIDVDSTVARAASAYHRDPNRPQPHNLYSSTSELYAAGVGLYQAVAPNPVFTYSKRAPAGATKVSEVHLPFSSWAADVYWRWDASKKAWLRFHGTVPHTLSDGTQVSAKDVVVQVVKLRLTNVKDANGVTSPEAITVGSGRAYVFRNGKVITGTWKRNGPSDLTKYYDDQGKEIPLTPGQAWVELFPDTLTVSYS